MHDVESFFWVLFWICMYFDGQDDREIKRLLRIHIFTASHRSLT